MSVYMGRVSAGHKPDNYTAVAAGDIRSQAVGTGPADKHRMSVAADRSSCFDTAAAVGRSHRRGIRDILTCQVQAGTGRRR
jgi:hypothetical protein